MDPLSQGVLGGLAAKSFSHKKECVAAGAIGFAAALLPDLDVFIRSSRDSLLFLDYHRQFTHSIVFMPIGALVATLVVWSVFKKRFASFWRMYLFALIGYATHAPLDACTSYGTQLFWPFSNERVAWNSVAIVDPLFTLPCLVILIIAMRRKSLVIARMGFLWSLLYLSFGFVQRDRAERALKEYATSQGHTPFRLTAKPSIFNNVLFRGIYEHESRYWVNAVRVNWWSEIKIYSGTSVPRLDIEKTIQDLKSKGQSQAAIDVGRFAHFSDQWLYSVSNNSDQEAIAFGDFRYSMLPTRDDPLWFISIPSRLSANEHVEYIMAQKVDSQLRNEYLKMLWGR